MLRLFELLFDLPPAIDAMVTTITARATENWSDLESQLGRVDPAVVAPYLGSYLNPELGKATLALSEGDLVFSASGFHSRLRPLLDATGTVTSYHFVDPPVARYTPPLTLVFPEDADRQSPMALTTSGDYGEGELFYPFGLVEPASTPAP
jgi:hypothetical protein